jgi:hypothetical protein
MSGQAVLSQGFRQAELGTDSAGVVEKLGIREGDPE